MLSLLPPSILIKIRCDSSWNVFFFAAKLDKITLVIQSHNENFIDHYRFLEYQGSLGFQVKIPSLSLSSATCSVNST